MATHLTERRLFESHTYITYITSLLTEFRFITWVTAVACVYRVCDQGDGKLRDPPNSPTLGEVVEFWRVDSFSAVALSEGDVFLGAVCWRVGGRFDSGSLRGLKKNDSGLFQSRWKMEVDGSIFCHIFSYYRFLFIRFHPSCWILVCNIPSK